MPAVRIERDAVRVFVRSLARKRITVPVSIVALAALATAYAMAGLQPSAAAGPSLARVSRGTVTVDVSAAGTVVAALTRGLSFSVSGTLTAVNVKPGDQVTAGQVLARIDDSAAQASVSAAQSQVDTANASLTAAQQTPAAAATRSATTARTLSPSCASTGGSTGRSPSGGTGTAPTATASTSRSIRPPTGSPTASGSPTPGRTASGTPGTGGHCPGTGSTGTGGATGSGSGTNGGNPPSGGGGGARGGVYSAQQQLNNAQLALSIAQRQLAGTTITAPVAGKVLSVAGIVGSAETPGSTPFIVLSGVSDVGVRARFSERDATRLAVGQDARITLPDQAGRTYQGRVAQVDPAGTVSGRLVLFGALIAFDQPPTGLLYGQSANVAVTVDTATGVLYLPSAAVNVDPAAGGALPGSPDGAATGSADGAATGSATPDAVGGTATVRLRIGAGYRTTTIQIGIRGDQFTEIRSGLAEGDRVAVSGDG